MSVVQFEELQALSGHKQVNEVVSFLRENRIRYVLGGDGLPRTTRDTLEDDLKVGRDRQNK